jgi:general secretion pathway protein A
MYESFFALTKAPFSLVPDPDCIHLTTQHADAISGLAFGVLHRKGCLVLTGEAGLGKTTALRALSQLLSSSNADLSMISTPTLTATEFLELAMLNFGLTDIPLSKARRLKLLEQFLLRSDADDRVAALVVDEAHLLNPEVLEELRLLGNLETSTRKLLQIVLAGQNPLNDQLNLPQLWQLKQRIAIRLSLRRLDREAVEEYIRFRWEKAGGRGELPFSAAAIYAIAVWSNGTPRLINIICDNALLIASSRETRNVDGKIICEACKELLLPITIPRVSPSLPGAQSLAGLRPALSETGKRDESGPHPDAWATWRSSLLKDCEALPAEDVQPAQSRADIISLNLSRHYREHE